MKNRINIEVFNNQERIDTDFISEEKIILLVEKILENENLEDNYSLDIGLVDNEQIREINQETRGVDKPTDVLSFPINYEIPGIESVFLGEIIISLEKVIEQAKDYKHSREREFYYLMAHGVLHLLGYDHMEEEEKKIMRKKEEDALQAFSIVR